MILALLAFGILPTDDEDTIQQKILEKEKIIYEKYSDIPEYVSLMYKFKAELTSKHLAIFFKGIQEKQLFLKVATENKNFFNISPEQLLILANLFQKNLLSHKIFLVLAHSSYFGYHNLSGTITQYTWQILALVDDGWEFIFATQCPPHFHQALLAFLELPVIKQWIVEYNLKIKSLIYFVAKIHRNTNENINHFIKRVIAPFKARNETDSSEIYYQVIKSFFSDPKLKEKTNIIELVLLATNSVTMNFYAQNIFSIEEFLECMHVHTASFIESKLLLLKDVFEQAIHLPKKIKTLDLGILWGKSDREIMAIIKTAEEYREWLEYPYVAPLLKKFSREIYIDSIAHLKENTTVLENFLNLLDDWHSFFNSSKVDINNFLLSRDSNDITNFISMLTNPTLGLNNLYLTGKICEEFLMYVTPRRVRGFLHFPQIADASLVNTIHDAAIKTIPLNCNLLFRRKQERGAFTNKMLEHLLQQSKQEQKTLVTYVQAGHSTIISSPELKPQPNTEGDVKTTPTKREKRKTPLNTAGDHLIFHNLITPSFY